MNSTRLKRLEAKKRKAEAFLRIAKLNDADKVMKEAFDVKIKKPKLEEQKASNPTKLTEKELLVGDDYAKLRAKLRARKKALQQLPKFDLKTLGHDASIENPVNLRTPLFLNDLQNVLAYTMVGDKTPYEPFCWCKLEKWNRLTNVICLIIEGISSKEFLENRDNKYIARMDKILVHKLEFLSPLSYGSSTARDLSILPVSKTLKNKLIKNFGNVKNLLKEGNAFNVYKSIFPISSPNKPIKESDMHLKIKLMLNPRQMVEENYPIPLPGLSKEKFKNYVYTQSSYLPPNHKSKLFSVDCEMCLTLPGKMELSRICVVDENLKVLYHTLVKPKNKITNYLTRFSGITEEMLKGVTTTLQDVQKHLQKLFTPDSILVGQSLNSDLHALEMMHPHVIDTSVIYCITGSRKRKTKLSVLSSMFLGQEIQIGGEKGHSPIEDAQAAMKLVKLKLEKGYEFGDVLLNGYIPNVEKTKTDNNTTPTLAMSMAELIKKNDKKMGFICQEELFEEYSEIPDNEKFLTKAQSANDAVEKACSSAFNNNLTVCHINLSSEDDNKFKLVKQYTKKLWKHTSSNGIFFTIWSGNETENSLVGISLRRTDHLVKASFDKDDSD